jgi:glutathione S-transferase
MQLTVELKDVEDEAIEAELIARGGKNLVPYLVDTSKDVEMYESDAIVAHLQTNYGTASTAPSRPRISISDNVCVSCEG